ncbi:hypothetical protein FQZ97_809470 [compost metagenome]
MCDVFLQRLCEGFKLLPKEHRDGILELRPANLQDVCEGLPLASKRGDQCRKSRDQFLTFPQHGQPNRGRVNVVGRLGEIHVIIWVDRIVAAWQAPQVLQRKIGDYLVDVHVGRGPRPALHHVDRKMRREDFADNQPAGGPFNRLCDGRREKPQFKIGCGGSLLHHSQGLHELRKILEPDPGDVEVLRCTQCMNTDQGVCRKRPGSE